MVDAREQNVFVNDESLCYGLVHDIWLVNVDTVFQHH